MRQQREQCLTLQLASSHAPAPSCGSTAGWMVPQQSCDGTFGCPCSHLLEEKPGEKGSSSVGFKHVQESHLAFKSAAGT